MREKDSGMSADHIIDTFSVPINMSGANEYCHTSGANGIATIIVGYQLTNVTKGVCYAPLIPSSVQGKWSYFTRYWY